MVSNRLRRAYTQKRENEFSDIIAGFYYGIGHGINKNAKKQSVLKYLVRVLGGNRLFLGKNQ